jgi:arylsulfatase A-like enzyme
MPHVQNLLGNQGATFENMFLTNPLCCPSNVSILTGQYSHNHQILHNVPPQGGFQKFVDMRTDGDPSTQGDEATLATWLQDSGYYTGRIGKYLVGYPENSTYIPPGWNDWFSTFGGAPGYYNYGVNDNGQVIRFGDRAEDYSTDVLTNRVISFLDQTEVNDAQPFFAFMAVSAPHAQGTPNGAPIPAPRHLGTFAGATAPRIPSFDEADVSDKPPHIRNLPLLTAGKIAAIDRQYQARLEALQAVDEGVARIIDALAARGELENTYIFFTADNGYHLGQHRQFQGKGEAYEEDIRAPLLVRGPGVRAGITLDQLALNIDFAPTITALAGASADRVMDGQSLAPLLVHNSPPSNWRHDFLVEIYRNPPMQPGSPGLALRTQHETYVEYADGFRELYDLRADPYQLQNIYATADPAHIAELSRRLAELAVSRGNPAKIDSVVVNDGSAQRSMVNSLTITFDRVVTFDEGAFEVRRQDGGAISLNVAASVVNGRTIAVLTFTGSDIVGGSLADGNYTLTIRGDHIRDEEGRELDGDNDGNGGGERVETFHRLFGDSDGDRDVDLGDLRRFLRTFGQRRGDLHYLAYMDVNGDDRVGVLDLLAFVRRLGTHLHP